MGGMGPGSAEELRARWSGFRGTGMMWALLSVPVRDQDHAQPVCGHHPKGAAIARIRGPEYGAALPAGAIIYDLAQQKRGVVATDIEKLFDLQQIDLKRLRIVKQVKKSLVSVREPIDLIRLRESVGSMSEEQESLKENQALAESQVKVVKEKIAANQDLLNSGRLTDPKDIAALQSQIAELESTKSAYEERALAALLEFEDKNKQYQPLVERLEEQTGEWEELRRCARAEQEGMAAELKELNRERSVCASDMNEDALQIYEELLKRKNGIAVTTITNSSCDACFMSLPTSVATAPRNGSSNYLHCPSCGRMLIQR